MDECNSIIDEHEMIGIIENLANKVLDRHQDSDRLVLIGIQRRGVDLAKRLKRILDERSGRDIPLGSLDINLYRDDWTSLDVQPMINQTAIPFDVSGKEVVLVDDVLFTGRTIRSALEAILDFGRPKLVELLVLVDRGHRELPIHADYVGRTISTGRGEHVDVYIKEKDGVDRVCLAQTGAAA